MKALKMATIIEYNPVFNFRLIVMEDVTQNQNLNDVFL